MRTSIDVAFQATFGMKQRCMMETKQYPDERSVSNEENDDYLSEEDGYPRVTEGGLIGKETVDFINGEGKYSDDNEDYSTDFDVY